MCSSVIFLLIFTSANAQKQYDIGESGCKAVFFTTPLCKFTYAEDSSSLWTCESFTDSLSYSLITVKFVTPVSDTARQEQILTAYMDFLKSIYAIEISQGYRQGIILESTPAARSMTDTWVDIEGIKIVVQGWVKEDFLVVMMVSGNEASTDNQGRIFFSGFRFPAP